MSGTKYDQDKAPLSINYHRGWARVHSNEWQDAYTSLRLRLSQVKGMILQNKRTTAIEAIKGLILNLQFELSILNLDLEDEVSRVCKFGADKYSEGNYLEGIHYDRLLSAALRHYKKHVKKEQIDSESGLLHIAHTAANLLMLIELIEEDKHR